MFEIGQREEVLAEALIAPGPIPLTFAEDALHIAVAAVNGARYLLTWNCTHINNAALRDRVAATCRA